MKYAIAIRNMGPQSTRETIRACARTAERLGFDAIFVSDHLCIPPDETEGSGGRYLDVLATLAFLAGATDRIRLGVSVLVLPYRPAVLTAKQVATFQELSGERMILGVGVGWMKREFEALGVDKRLRSQMSNETLRVLRHLFTTEPTAYRGDLVSFPAFVFEPRPKCPPIWIGGNGAAARRRAVEVADGWAPLAGPPLQSVEMLAQHIADVNRRRAERGRGRADVSFIPYEADLLARGDACDMFCAAVKPRVDAYAGAGVTWLTIEPTSRSYDDFRADIDLLAAKLVHA